MPAKYCLWLDQPDPMFEGAGRSAGLLFQLAGQHCQSQPFRSIRSHWFLPFSFGHAELIAKKHDFQVLLGFRHTTNLNEGDKCGKELCNQEPNHENAYSNSGIALILLDSRFGAYF
jgi:hypothetical protein